MRSCGVETPRSGLRAIPAAGALHSALLKYTPCPFDPQLRAGNALGDALRDEGPFDAIHVGAAAEHPPEVLVGKLARGGRMVVPVGPHWDGQVLQVVDKDSEGRVKKHNLMGVRYVPLTKPGEE